MPFLAVEAMAVLLKYRESSTKDGPPVMPIIRFVSEWQDLMRECKVPKGVEEGSRSKQLLDQGSPHFGEL